MTDDIQDAINKGLIKVERVDLAEVAQPCILDFSYIEEQIAYDNRPADRETLDFKLSHLYPTWQITNKYGVLN